MLRHDSLKKKLLILTAIFIVSTAFFWYLMNRFVFRIEAVTEPVRVFFDKIEVATPANRPVAINVFFAATAPENKISGGTVTLNYPKELLSFHTRLKDQVDTVCTNNGFALTTLANVLDDPVGGKVTLSRVILDRENAALPPRSESGMFCMSTFYFIPSGSIKSFPQQATVSFNTDEGACEIVGPDKKYRCEFFEESNSVKVAINEPVKGGDGEALCRSSGGSWREFPDSCADQCGDRLQVCAQVLTQSCDCGTGKCWNGRACVLDKEGPPLTPPARCAKFEAGDCNCDSVLDLKDFNRWRVGYTGSRSADVMRPLPSLTCDFNGDVSQDLVDFNIWRGNYFKSLY